MLRNTFKKVSLFATLFFVCLMTLTLLLPLTKGHSGLAYAGDVPDTEILYFPHLNLGKGLQATITITNTEAREVDVTLKAYDRGGSPLGVVAAVTRLGAGETKNIDAQILPSGTASLKVESNGNLFGNIILKSIDGTKSEVVPAIKESSRQLDFPTLIAYDSYYKTITILNPSCCSPTPVSIIALKKDGYEIARNTLPSLLPMESRAISLASVFSNNTLKNLSTVRIVSVRDIVGLYLVDYTDGDLVGLPALTTTSKGWSFPITTRGGDLELWTTVGVFNPGNTPANITVEAFDASGNTLGVIGRTTIPARTTHLMTTTNIGGIISLETSTLKVTSDQPISGYEVIGVVNGYGLSATMGIPEEEQTITGFELIGSEDGSVLNAYPMVRMGDGSVKSTAGSLGSWEWNEVVSIKSVASNQALTTATVAATYSISGKITLGGNGRQGITVSLSGPVSKTTTTDSTGNYSFSGLGNGTYTITPSKAGYAFNPTSLSVTISGSNVTGRNFIAKIISSEQLQLKAPWFGKALITQGNNGTCSHNVCGKRTSCPDVDNTDCNWENTYALDIQQFDSAGSINFNIPAPADGVISYVEDNTLYSGGRQLGLRITGPTGGTYELIFLHLSEIKTKYKTLNTPVKQGEIIAVSGRSGKGSEEYWPKHLHFHIWDSNVGSRHSHTMPIGQIWMRQDGESSFKNYESKGDGDDNLTKGSLDDTAVAGKYFWSDQGITVTSPNGGESWQAGTTQTIRWTYTGSPGSYVKIELYKGGVFNSTITSSTLTSTGSYNWTILSTQIPGSDYKVKVTSTTNSSYYDYSNNNFTITAPTTTSITVISPNGGESWQAGTTQTIRWTYTGSPGSYVKIELYKGGVFNSTITSSTLTSTGSYNWTILSTQIPGSDYKVKVTSTTNSSYYDYSNNNFTITAPTTTSITVISPNGGEVWTVGSTRTITWTSSNLNSAGRIYVFYWYNNSWQQIAGPLSTTTTSFSWTIPNTPTTSSSMWVGNWVNNAWAAFDQSDQPFTIISNGTSSIRVISPNGGEVWTVGSARTITWTSSNLNSAGRIYIFYWYNNSWQQIAGPLSTTTTSFSWTIPNTPTTSSSMWVGNWVNNAWAAFDQSDQPFTIR